ncbi:MAG: GTPase HflX [Spirochaetales bacterium]|nr:GTPase HflX [Spirochaetales bacterium]
MKQEIYETQIKEKAILIGVESRKSRSGLFTIHDSLNELAQLAGTLNIEVVGKLAQRLEHPCPDTYVGPGKLVEISALVEELAPSMLLFDDELTSLQLRNLEKELGKGLFIIDRTSLILNIFAEHAHSKEGKLQVELAKIEYQLPRLRRVWDHLAQQTGGRSAGIAGAGVRGTGEKMIEMDKRLIRDRIVRLKRRIKEIQGQRNEQYKKRLKNKVPLVAIVGYTNAGKSTLLHALSRADILVDDKLFATLEPATRRVRLASGFDVLFTDTVGFINKLPHSLVEAFKATLEGVQQADLLLHVADASHPMIDGQVSAVHRVLEEIGVHHKPQIMVWNKIDRIAEHNGEGLNGKNEAAISAKTGGGLERLLGMIEKFFKDRFVEVVLDLPYSAGDLLNIIYLQGKVLEKKPMDTGYLLKALVPPALIGQLAPYRREES